MCQLCHHRKFRAGKDCIGLCRSFHIVALCLHSLHNFLYVFNHLMVLLWIGRWCTGDVLYCRGVTPLSCGCYRSFLLLMHLVEFYYYFAHVLRSADCRLHSFMSSLKINVCARRVIPFDIIMASEIVWPPTLENSLPVSNSSIVQDRGSAGSYDPIILTSFSLRSILSITPYLENICFSMVSADTGTKLVS